ncbi:Nucleolar protein 4 [Eumeta japonica]|uniref:Nucleolar protein 4 n=1 Tax=Eumeta variegata TaxID=151549 RepID=A0A4C1YQS9_EUMVA|nr:Nucleolar protein 4 [Eumeta japonica]
MFTKGLKPIQNSELLKSGTITAMAAAMISDRGLRKKLTQEALPERPPRKPSKRKSTAGGSRRNEQNNNSKKPKVQTGDPKLDLFSTYQPWVIQTYGDLAKTKTITLKKYARILRTLRGEECNSSDSSKFRFWVKAKGFHIGKPMGYDARPADGIVCRYSVLDADGCARGPDGHELYSGSQNDPPLYIPTPPLKNRRIRYVELERELDIGSAVMKTIIHDRHSLRKRCSIWVSHKLIDKHKDHRVDWCRYMIEEFYIGEIKNVYNMLTGNETQPYNYNSETKRQSTVWCLENEPTPTKCRRARSMQ